LENQEYVRRFGLFSMASEDKDGDLYFKVSNGQIKIKTRFNLILATMRNFATSQDIGIKALCSRCLRYRFSLNKKELTKIALGENIINLTKYNPDETTTISLYTYKKIISIVKKSGIHETHFLRSINDMCRIFAVTGKLDNKLMKFGISLHLKEKEDQQNAIRRYFEKQKEKK